jgi:hypothetical protein
MNPKTIKALEILGKVGMWMFILTPFVAMVLNRPPLPPMVGMAYIIAGITLILAMIHYYVACGRVR